MIRVLALVPYPLGLVGGQRYRIEQWQPYLAELGVELRFAPFLTRQGMAAVYQRGMGRKLTALALAYVRRLRTVIDPGRYDVAYVYRETALMGGAWLERLLRLPFVFDFDDAIFLRPPVSLNPGASLLKSTGKPAALCHLAAHVTVGNEFLAAFARRHAARVTVIPSTIDTDVYRLAPRSGGPRPVIGWTGSPTTVCYLEAISAALRELRQTVDFRLRVIGAEFGLEGVEVETLPWRAESETQDLSPLDVGLMPLEDDDWCRGKCGLKALQYMALGIPPVVSPIGANLDIVQDGVNGFLASSRDQWVERIVTLVRDPERRARMGQAARRTVEERYSARVHAPRLASLLREVAAR